MENGQIPPVQPYVTASGQPMVQQVQVMPRPRGTGLGKTIAIIALSLVALTFVGLFVWMFVQYDEARTDVDGQIATAVAKARDEQAEKDEAEFLEREKYPYKTFSGPVDYGELGFEYPKTWSVYIEKDAANGGDFQAYLSPTQIDPVSDSTIYALRVQIVNRNFEDVIGSYEGALKNKEKPLTVSSVIVGGATANLYEGAIPGTEFNGYILVLKIRDKTAILRTDSMLFEEDFKKLIDTITFNA